MNETGPLSPKEVTGSGGGELPAYISNGVIGLRVRHQPLEAGMCMLNGYTGKHPVRGIEAAAGAPYPLAGDISINGIWLSDSPENASRFRQSVNFSNGELTSEFTFKARGSEVRLSILTFCCKHLPALVCQSVELKFNQECDVVFACGIDTSSIAGQLLSILKDTPGEAKPCCDGILHWESDDAIASCGVAYISECKSRAKVEREVGKDKSRLVTNYKFRAHQGSQYLIRHMTLTVPGSMHQQPHLEAGRLAAFVKARGFEKARAANRADWKEIWKGRIRLVGASRRWQQLADAAFFYLNMSVHASSPASTSIFGLATWKDYHYYYGAVMWDIERFSAPVLSLLQPNAAAALLDYRSRNTEAAKQNARLMGRSGLQFPWMSAASSGQEVSPLPGEGAWQEDHVSLDIALAFSFHADTTGDRNFLADKAWPILQGVADWIVSRVKRTSRGYEILDSMGIAETKKPVDNPAFTNMSAKMVLKAAIEAARRLGRDPGDAWQEIADGLVLPTRDDIIVSHDHFRIDEDKGSTPEPLMGLFPVWHEPESSSSKATLDFYLKSAGNYNGSPMLSALYGVWACWAGKRQLALDLLEEGYGKMVTGRFLQTTEYLEKKFPEQPVAAPLIANLSGFLLGLVLGLPGLRPDHGNPSAWGRRPVVLPAGWKAIEIDRLWIHGRPARLSACHGADGATIQFID